MKIEVRELTKRYGPQLAVDNISFTVNTGEIVGFLGPNGAGKTTTMKIITNFIAPTSGDVLIDGTSIREQPNEIKRHIGYLPENNPLYNDMPVIDYLRFVGELLNLDNLTGRIKDVIEKVGLYDEKHKKIGELSKGYKQRVGLAQAIIHDPDVLVLDEPTSGLDPNQIIEIRNLIKQLGQQKTVLLSTHIMQEVEAICDRIIIINKGRIVADDTPETIQHRVEDSMLKFLIEFDRDVDRKELEKIPGAEEIHYIRENKWLIVSLDDIRKDIFQFAVARNLTVLTIEQKKKSLEEIFRELTTGSNKPDRDVDE